MKLHVFFFFIMVPFFSCSMDQSLPKSEKQVQQSNADKVRQQQDDSGQQKKGWDRQSVQVIANDNGYKKKRISRIR